MRKTTIIIRVVILLLMSLQLSSCEKILHIWDFDPYSNNRNENISMFGFYWDGHKYKQSVYAYIIAPQDTGIQWSLTKIDNKEYIIAEVELQENYSYREDIYLQEMLFAIPYEDIEVGKRYTSSVTSYITLYSSNYEPFMVNGENGYRLIVPLKVDLTYTEKGSVVQGKFEAEGGTLTTFDGQEIRFRLEKGQFSFNFSDKFNKEYTYEDWITTVNDIAEGFENYNRVTEEVSYVNPYLDNRDERYSMIGAGWDGFHYMSSIKKTGYSWRTMVRWDIVTTGDDEHFIVVWAPMTMAQQVIDRDNRPNHGIGILALILPYDGIELGEEYRDSQKLSSAELAQYMSTTFPSNYFIVDGQESIFVAASLCVSVRYDRTGDIIQGSFTAEGGTVEMKGAGKQRIILDDGVFSLNINDGKGYTYEEWLDDSSLKQYARIDYEAGWE